MRVHDARFNSDYQLYAVRAAAEAEAVSEAEQARKQLQAASSMAKGAEEEDCVVTLREREDDEGQAPQQDQSDRGGDAEPSDAGTGSSDNRPYSEYA
jgi:hypothetical protein